MRVADFIDGLIGGLWAWGLTLFVIMGAMLVFYRNQSVMFVPDEIFISWGFSPPVASYMTTGCIVVIFAIGFVVGVFALRDRPQMKKG